MTAVSEYKCGLCSGAGLVSLPARPPKEGEEGYQFDLYGGQLTMTAFPCTCPVGLDRRQHMPQLSDTTVKRASMMLADYLMLCQVPEDDKPIGIKEFFDKHAGKFRPVSDLMNEIIHESMREEAKANGKPEGPAYVRFDAAKSPTIAEILRRREKRAKAATTAPAETVAKVDQVPAVTTYVPSPAAVAAAKHANADRGLVPVAAKVVSVIPVDDYEQKEREAIQAETRVQKNVKDDLPW